MGDPTTYHFRLPRYQGAPLPEPPHSWYPGVRQHQSASTSDRTVHADGKVRAFVIHATAGTSSAGAMGIMFAHRASWHWLIPDENEAQHGKAVWACAPESRAAWHVRNDCSHPDVNAGARYINYWSLGVEIVNSQHADKFSNWQVEQAAALVRYAWSTYPELVDVVSHARLDPGRRTDPGAAFPWERFRELVLAAPEPAAVASAATPRAAAGPIVVVGPSGRRIECDARLLDGVTVVEARPLIEALGYRVEYAAGPPMVMNIRARGTVASPKRAPPRTGRRNA